MNLKKFITAATFTFAAGAFCSGAFADDVKPILQHGKKNLYEKILTTPGCKLYADENAADGSALPAFTRFYVYQNKGKRWQVGPDDKGNNLGFIDESCQVPWKMQMAMVFTNSAGRDRTLIFKKKSALEDLIDDPDIDTLASKLNESLKKGETPEGVISAEPENFIDYTKHFYLMPVLDYKETAFAADSNNDLMLQIASVSDGNGKAEYQDDERELKEFKAAVVFVIDTTISMQPYIDRTKETIRKVVKSVCDEDLEESVHFGLVSFRSDLKTAPKLEYTTRVYVKPGEATSVKSFEQKLGDLKQATASSAKFDEDAYAGISDALEKIDWSDYGGRYVVLITDAGAIKGDDPLSSTKLDAEILRKQARDKGVAIYALHLLTDSGARNGNHDKAKAQYKTLTFNDIVNKSLYYQVQAGNVESFGRTIDKFALDITSQVKSAAFGEEAVGSAESTAQAAQTDSDKTMEEDTVLLGNAMKLAYLGSKQGQSAPPFFEGWLSSRDLTKRTKASVVPVVMLTKNELATLAQITQETLEAESTGVLDSEGMFVQLQDIASKLGRDPNQLASAATQNRTPSSEGVIGEYLDGLPYKSEVAELTRESWESMGPDEQSRMIERLEEKLLYYKKCNENNDLWVKLNPQDDDAQAVFPVNLDALP
ncbi:MAG: serine/threonine protein kinase [Succinivibrio sp.]|jgi:hypothetical protein|nr:serine/threonine protein kinase [Succinivibrio sp.]